MTGQQPPTWRVDMADGEEAAEFAQGLWDLNYTVVGEDIEGLERLWAHGNQDILLDHLEPLITDTLSTTDMRDGDGMNDILPTTETETGLWDVRGIGMGGEMEWLGLEVGSNQDQMTFGDFRSAVADRHHEMDREGEVGAAGVPQ